MTAGVGARSAGDIVRDWIEHVWNRVELDRLGEFHPQTWLDSGREVQAEDAAAWHRRMRDTYPDLHYAIDDLFVAGDRVTVRWTATGTQEGTLWGVIPPTGRRVTWSGIHVLTVREGRIAEIWAVADLAAVMEQLHLRPVAQDQE